MTPIALDGAEHQALKNYFTTVLPDIKSSHRAEAIARGLGYGSNATLLAALSEGAVYARADEASFRAYLTAKGFDAGAHQLADGLSHVILRRLHAEQPDLHTIGLGPVEPLGITPAEASARFDVARADLLSPNSARAFSTAVYFASRLLPHEEVVSSPSSYGIKHSLERYAAEHRELGLARYIPNGIMIAAMIHTKFAWERLGDTPNAAFGVALDGQGRLLIGPERYIGLQWQVTDWTVETDGAGYWFEFDRLGEKHHAAGLYDWIIHLAEKTWVDMEDFVPAFRNAFDAHGPGELDAKLLERSVAEARRIRREANIPWPGEKRHSSDTDTDTDDVGLYSISDF